MLTEETEQQLRDAFANSISGISIPDDLAARLRNQSHRAYCKHRMARRLVPGAAGIACIVGVALAFALGTGGPPARDGATMRVASYSFHLPRGYRLVDTSSGLSCVMSMEYIGPNGSSTGATQGSTLPYSSGIESAASGSGGCIAMLLDPSYTPTATTPDPEAIGSALTPVAVGSYKGFVETVTLGAGHPGTVGTGILRLIQVPHGSQGPPRYTNLFVEISIGNGQVRDLVVSASGLSQSALIGIVATGLSTPAS
jgi:hypothetical protein